MKQTIIFLGLMAFICIELNGQGQKRVHLVHGYGGDMSRLADMENELINNCQPPVGIQVNPSNASYNSNDGIAAFQTDFLNRQSEFSSSSDIAIGHSFGGIILRSLDELDNGLFGGYITIASSHQGAQIANSVNDGLVENFVETACTEALDDPVTAFNRGAQASWNAIIAHGLGEVLFTMIDDLATVFCNGIWESALDGEGLRWRLGQSVDDQEVGGAGSNLLPSTLPSVGISGFLPQNEDVHWRLIEDITGTEVGTLMDDVINEYTAAADWLRENSSLWYVRIAGLGRGMRAAAREMDQAADWIAASEAGWAEIIGAGGGIRIVNVSVEVPSWTVQGDECIGVYDCPPGKKCIQGHCVNFDGSPCDDNGSPTTTTIIVPRVIANPDLPNDGILTLGTQQLPGALFNDTPVENVSHFGEPSDRGVWDQINAQFNPGTSAAQVFHIPGCSI